jgi:2'-5' RNA ligase
VVALQPESERNDVRDGQRVRAFFAVALDAATRRDAAAWTHCLRARPGGDAVRWVREESLHVTLHFLGDIDRARVPDLVRGVALETAGVEPFRLGLGAAQLFPSERRPRVVALALEPLPPLEALAGAVGRGAAAAGFALEERPFRAHLTLGRVKGRAAQRLDVTAPDTLGSQTCHVTEVVLFRSELQRTGARYTPLDRALLGARAGSNRP